MTKYKNLDALGRIKRCIGTLIQTQPFYGVLAMECVLVEAPHLTDTLAVDGTHFFFNPSYVMELAEIELVGDTAHEVSHLAYKHHLRLGDRELRLANEAADYAVNRDIIAAGFTMRKDYLYDARFNGMAFEQIYAILEREKASKPQPQPQNGQGHPQQNGQPQSGQNGGQSQGQKPDNNQSGKGNGTGQKSGQEKGQNGQPDASQGQDSGKGQPASGNASMVQPDGNKDGHGNGGIMRPAIGTEFDQEQKWQIVVRQAANVAKKHNAGTMPAYLQTLVNEISQPIIDARELLAHFIDSTIATDYSFAKPNRRYVSSGFYLPTATVDAIAHLVCIVDTSGSMTTRMFSKIAGFIRESMEAGKVERLTVIMADVRVTFVKEFEMHDDIELQFNGGGGTRFDTAIQYVVDNIDDATAIIYLTDMECERFGNDPEIPLLWAIHSKPQAFDRLADKAPFGEPVYLGQL